MCIYLTFSDIIVYENLVLLFLSTGLLFVRIYFHDFMRSDEPYKNSHIFYLMLFTVFASMMLMVFYWFFYYHHNFEQAQIDFIVIKSLIILPKVIFYTILFYFLYWVFYVIQSRQEYYLEIKAFYEQNQHDAQNEIDRLEALIHPPENETPSQMEGSE